MSIALRNNQLKAKNISSEYKSAQTTIPSHIDVAIRKYVKKEGFTRSVYYRKLIIEGYKRDVEKVK